ncbi:hypothetical protein D3C75_1181590 [compost metagenome]
MPVNKKKPVTFRPFKVPRYAFDKLRICRRCGRYTALSEDRCGQCGRAEFLSNFPMYLFRHGACVT